ncbi:MAG TPA: hypothetical protein DHV17_03820 [Chitinophagaceae bacterium]|nr:hypothetical protein [Chitinophagaceae bacterium]
MIPLYILLTAFTAQFVYIVVNWFYFRRSEYFFYSIYIIILSLYFLNRIIGDEQGMLHFAGISLYKMYPDRILAILSYIYYFKFGRRFVEAETRYPGIHKTMMLTERLLFLYIGIDIILFTLTGYSKFANLIFIPVNVCIFLVLGYVFWTMLKRREALDKFILTGSMFYGISAVVTLIMGIGKDILENDHMLALQIGALVEMLFLNAGLVYKSRMLQQEIISSQTQLIKQYEDNQHLMNRLNNIRERISRDLHDDVGATLSSIKAYSEILKINPQAPSIADLIRDNSTEMIERLELIAWSANPEHDHPKSLVFQMQKFAAPLCHARNIHFHFDHTALDDTLMIPGEIRQQVYLVFKEAINNMVKYAEAANCNAVLRIDPRGLSLYIKDDGKGFDDRYVEHGNGLKNMRKRVENLGGLLTIETAPQQGTRISMQIPLVYRIQEKAEP